MLGQDDFVLGKKLGEGAFGVVCKASLANPEAAEKVKANVASACKGFNSGCQSILAHWLGRQSGIAGIEMLRTWACSVCVLDLTPGMIGELCS